MFRFLLVTLALSLTSYSFGQESFLEKKPITVSYFGQMLFHPGIKVGTQYDFREWTTQKEKKKGERIKEKSLFVSPQIGFYSHPRNHSGLIISADVGYQRIKLKRGFYSAYSIGLGYFAQFNAGTTYTVEADGTVNQKRFASRSYFLPTINTEFGQKVTPKIGWFSKISIGLPVAYNTGVSALPFIEFGMKYNLGL